MTYQNIFVARLTLARALSHLYNRSSRVIAGAVCWETQSDKDAAVILERLLRELERDSQRKGWRSA